MSTCGYHHNFEARVTACPALTVTPPAQLIEQRRRERAERERRQRRGMRR